MTTGEIAVAILGTLVIVSAGALVDVIVKLNEMRDRDWD